MSSAPFSDTVRELPAPEGVAVRTMRNDLEETRRKHILAPVLKTRSTASRSIDIPSTPLVVEQPHMTDRSIIPPKSKTSRAWVIPVIVIIVVGIVAGGIVLWRSSLLTFFAQRKPGGDVSSDVRIDALIPLNASLVARYNLSDRSLREKLLRIHEGSDALPHSFVNGDPSLAVRDESIHELFYVLLPDNARFYVVVPLTNVTEALLNDSSVQAVRRGQYIIGHALDVEGYLQQLSSGSWGESGGLPPMSQKLPLQIITSSAFIESLAGTVTDDSITSFSGSIVLNGVLLEDSVLGLTNGATLINIGAEPVDARILSYIPDDSVFVRIGDNLAFDIDHKEISEFMTRIDSSSFANPSVNAVISKLSAPYSFIRRPGAIRDEIGLIVLIPPDLQGSLFMPNSAVETALQDLAALILPGENSIPNLVFNDAVYNDVAIRYVNISSSSTAVDYTVADDVILIAASKNGMTALIDTYKKGSASINQSHQWQPLLRYTERRHGTASALYAGVLSHELFKELFHTEGGNVRHITSLQPVGVSLEVRSIIDISSSPDPL